MRGMFAESELRPRPVSFPARKRVHPFPARLFRADGKPAYGAAGVLTRKLALIGFKRTISGVATPAPAGGENIKGWMLVGPSCGSGVASQ